MKQFHKPEELQFATAIIQCSEFSKHERLESFRSTYWKVFSISESAIGQAATSFREEDDASARSLIKSSFRFESSEHVRSLQIC